MASPTSLRSSTLLDCLESICLLLIYLATQLSNSLIFLVSEAKCSIDLWSEMEQKFSFYKLGSVGILGSYRSWMLITSSSTCWIHLDIRAGTFSSPCCIHALFSWSVALLTCISFGSA